MKSFTIPGTMAAVLLLAGLATAQQATEPLHYSKLIPLLPDQVEGFVAEKAGGSTASAADFKLTEVTRVYHKASDGADEWAAIKITDGAGNQSFAAARAAVPQASNEGPEGYSKAFKLDGYQAVERYANDSKEGSLTVLVGNRYVVEIDVNGLDSNALQEMWKKVDARKLEALKAS
jgi:hypothetical protein